MNWLRVARSVLSLVLTSVWVAGCSSADSLDRVPVEGTVNVNGTPLQEGRIAFLPEKGTPGPAIGGRIENGRFKISRDQGPAAGRHRVQITSLRPTGKKILQFAGDGPTDDPNDPGELVDEIMQFIPAEYNQKSILLVDVNSTNCRALTFDLEFP